MFVGFVGYINIYLVCSYLMIYWWEEGLYTNGPWVHSINRQLMSCNLEGGRINQPILEQIWCNKPEAIIGNPMPDSSLELPGDTIHITIQWLFESGK